MNKSVFNTYSQYYDLLYSDKNYVKETNYIISVLTHNGLENSNILEFGSGTGKHGSLLAKALASKGEDEEKDEAERLKFYYYEFFITRIGSAPFKGTGASIKKSATDVANDGMAYRIYGCGIKNGDDIDPMVVPLESVVVLPK